MNSEDNNIVSNAYNTYARIKLVVVLLLTVYKYTVPVFKTLPAALTTVTLMEFGSKRP